MNSILIITGNQRRHRYFVNTLNAHFDIVGVLSESVYQPPLVGLVEDVNVIKKHFLERDEAELEYFKHDDEFNLPEKNFLSLNKGEANSEWVVNWIGSRKPDFIILYGSGIIQKILLERYVDKVINMHLGLSPYYRGSGTNFWPLVNNEPELVGTTIHLASQVIDGGAILGQVRPSPVITDRCHDLGCKSIIAGAGLMIRCIQSHGKGQIQPFPQKAKGNLYRRSDFTAEAVRKMWLNFDNGMMENYLTAMLARQSAYPILD